MCECIENKIKKETKEILEQYKIDKENLIPILNDVQEKYGYIPKIAQLEISKYLDVPMAEIYGVITFYSRFTLVPKGKYNVSICHSLLIRQKKHLNDTSFYLYFIINIVLLYIPYVLPFYHI